MYFGTLLYNLLRMYPLFYPLYHTDPYQKWPNLPLITGRDVDGPAHIEKPQAWLETLSFKENIKLGLVDLHPDVYATFPR